VSEYERRDADDGCVMVETQASGYLHRRVWRGLQRVEAEYPDDGVPFVTDANDPTPADIVAHLLDKPNDAWEVLRQLSKRVAGPTWSFYRPYFRSTVPCSVEGEGGRPACDDAALTAAGWVLADREIVGTTRDGGAEE